MAALWGLAAGLAVYFVVQPIRVLRHISSSWYFYSMAASKIFAAGSHAIYSATAQTQVLSAYSGFPVANNEVTQYDRPPIEAWILMPFRT